MDMDSDGGLIGRLEVVNTGRRRRWSDAEKVRIVEESLSGRRLASATARRHGISRTLLFRWRKAYREGRLDGGQASVFVPAMVVPEEPDPPAREAASSGRMEIVVGDGRSVIVGPDVDPGALARVLAVLEGR
ncbi:IS66-like element accessory protein TnpA [Pelagibius marinus]|uniref:IS66-like element accessory protein TnpA n=1 Tax=Pelagibius marinus TaxID=2762760 RepID=UPI001D04D7E4|nr:transposase [Pelagibius marinus]